MNDTFLLIAAAAAYNNVSAVTVSVCRTCFCCSCVPYVPEPEDRNLMKTALSIYRKFDKWPDAMICAISLNDMDLIKEIFLDFRKDRARNQIKIACVKSIFGYIKRTDIVTNYIGGYGLSRILEINNDGQDV